MGKKSRRPSRQNRHELNMRREGLTVTVGVAPQAKPSGQPSLENELRLLRSALLYADHVDLVAPSAAWMQDFRPLRGVDADDPWRTITALPSETMWRIGVQDVSSRDFRRAMRKLAARPADDPDRMANEQQWRDAIPALKRQAEEVFDSVESEELDMALDVAAVTMVSEGTRFEDATDRQMAWFRDRLVEALENPRAHVLLDDIAAGSLRSSEGFADGLQPVPDSRTRRAAVGAGLLERLPTFPDAPMEHVLEARDELADGRSRYRTSVKSLADQLQSSALDETLTSEIDELWHDEVRPSLDDLRNTASKTRVAMETGKRLATEGYGIPTLMVTIANLPDLAAMLPTAVTMGAAAGRVAAAGAGEAFRARSVVKNHELVYLLDVDKRLGRSRR